MLARGMIATALLVAGSFAPTAILAQDAPGAPAAASNEDGKYFDANGDPTFNIGEGGIVDWYTYSGYRRYHAECHVCHGPDGEGSSYAPRLVDSLKHMNYTAFLDVVTNGRKNVNAGSQNVMPAFGTNLNVMCYIDDIYAYLRARAQGDAPRGRPPKHEDKPEAAKEAEKSCLGT